MSDGFEFLGFFVICFIVVEILIPMLSYYWTGYVNQSDSNKHSD
jgi:hypothetical protein